MFRGRGGDSDAEVGEEYNRAGRRRWGRKRWGSRSERVLEAQVWHAASRATDAVFETKVGDDDATPMPFQAPFVDAPQMCESKHGERKHAQ